MGLAASQARFLAITARKADCEFRSMQIAQNKLSVTRELQAATEVYQNALNAETLVWDYDGTGSDLQAVSYNMMMRPSMYNNYNPYLLTDRSGRVIVSDGIAAAAKLAGIDPDKGGTRSDLAFDKFLRALDSTDVLSNQTYESMENAVYNASLWTDDKGQVLQRKDGSYAVPVYVNRSGEYLGPVFSNNSNPSSVQDYYTRTVNEPPEDADRIAYAIATTSARSTDNILTNLNAVKNRSNITIEGKDYPATMDFLNKQLGIFLVKSQYSEKNGYGDEPMSKNQLVGINIIQMANAFKDKVITRGTDTVTLDNINMAKDTLINQLPAKNKDGKSYDYKITKNGTRVEYSRFDEVKLSDILSGDVVLSCTQPDGEHTYPGNLNNFVKVFLEDAVKQIGKAIGVYDSNGLTLDADRETIFNIAKQMTLSQFSNYNMVETKNTADVDARDAAINASRTKNSVMFMQNNGGKRNSSSAVDLSNLVSYFLTMATVMADGFESNYAAVEDVAQCVFVTSDPDYRFMIEDDGTQTNTSVLKADFYQQLFNNLCINGYKTDTRVQNDNDYLKQMLQNGAYFVSSLNNDGHFYQARYCDAVNTLIRVVADEDAIAVAESEYNYMKIKLTAKEDKLDLDMKNIDMEISALTTEYDSVKNLIAKSIEKTFKQFEG